MVLKANISFVFLLLTSITLSEFDGTLKNFEALAYAAFVSIQQTIGLALSLLIDKVLEVAKSTTTLLVSIKSTPRTKNNEDL